MPPASSPPRPLRLAALRAGAHRASGPGRRRAPRGGRAAVVTLVTALLLRPTASERPTARSGSPAADTAAADVVRWTRARAAGRQHPVTDELLDDAERRPRRRRSARSTPRRPAHCSSSGRAAGGSLVLARFADPDGAALIVVDPDARSDRRRRTRPAAEPRRGVLANPVTGATGRADRGAAAGERRRAPARACSPSWSPGSASASPTSRRPPASRTTASTGTSAARRRGRRTATGTRRRGHGASSSPSSRPSARRSRRTRSCRTDGRRPRRVPTTCPRTTTLVADAAP